METIATSPEVLSFAKYAVIFLGCGFGIFMVFAALCCNYINHGENIDKDECLALEGEWVEYCNTDIIFSDIQMSEN